MYGYIYKTTCLVNNLIYIGQKKSPEFLGQRYLGSGIILKQAINKYGKENFTVDLIESCNSREELNSKEIFWISKLNSRDNSVGYNIAVGGNYFDNGYHQGMKGKKQSEYQKQIARSNGDKIREGQLKPEVRLKMSNSAKKRKDNRITNGNYTRINKDGINKMVKPEDLNLYLSEGWNIGIIRSEQSKINSKNRYANGSYINKDGNIKFIQNDLLEYYLTDGWDLGKKPKDQYKSSNHKYF